MEPFSSRILRVLKVKLDSANPSPGYVRIGQSFFQVKDLTHMRWVADLKQVSPDQATW